MGGRFEVTVAGNLVHSKMVGVLTLMGELLGINIIEW